MIGTDVITSLRRYSPNLRDKIRVVPTQLFCRLLIHNAFLDAVETKNGKPTINALRAVEWLEARTNWTRIPAAERMARWGHVAPPESIRQEYWGTCSWASQWLGLDEDVVRQQGLPRSVWSQDHIQGLPAVRDAWEKARLDYDRSSSKVTGQTSGQ